MDRLTYHNCGWLGSVEIFYKSDNEVLNLKRSCPDLPEMPRSLQSIKTLCFFLSNPPRLSQEKRGLLDSDLGEGVWPTLASYYTPASSPEPDEKLSVMFINWAKVGLETEEFFLQKTKYAISIIKL